jgi:hypothetical protein
MYIMTGQMSAGMGELVGEVVARQTHFWSEVEVKLRLMVIRPVYLGARLPSEAHDQICIFCLTVAGFLAVSDERMGL